MAGIVPSTAVRTSHALTIQANGVTIGLINSWAPKQSRHATPIYEIDADNSGNIQEIMPGNLSGTTIDVSRYDLYINRMEQAFGVGFADYVQLTSQNQPFDVYEVWKVNPAQDLERFAYQGCWFTSLGRTLRSDDSRVVNVNATLMYTKKVKISGITALIPQINLPGIRGVTG